MSTENLNIPNPINPKLRLNQLVINVDIWNTHSTNLPKPIFYPIKTEFYTVKYARPRAKPNLNLIRTTHIQFGRCLILTGYVLL